LSFNSIFIRFSKFVIVFQYRWIWSVLSKGHQVGAWIGLLRFVCNNWSRTRCIGWFSRELMRMPLCCLDYPSSCPLRAICRSWANWSLRPIISTRIAQFWHLMRSCRFHTNYPWTTFAGVGSKLCHVLRAWITVL
jgi:hypothetical protein